MEYDKIRKSFIAFKRDLDIPFKTVECRGIWIKGSPGIGKTHTIMENFGHELYEKS